VENAGIKPATSEGEQTKTKLFPQGDTQTNMQHLAELTIWTVIDALDEGTQ